MKNIIISQTIIKRKFYYIKTTYRSMRHVYTKFSVVLAFRECSCSCHYITTGSNKIGWKK